MGMTIDFFLIFLIYFSFNRHFFNGLLWMLGIALFESALGFSWSGAQLSLMMVVFMIIQGMKLKFIFQRPRAIYISVFLLCMFEHVAHYVIASHLSWGDIIEYHAATIVFSSFMHALLAPLIFEMLTVLDQKHVYLFEKQRTLFQGRIKSL